MPISNAEMEREIAKLKKEVAHWKFRYDSVEFRAREYRDEVDFLRKVLANISEAWKAGE